MERFEHQVGHATLLLPQSLIIYITPLDDEPTIQVVKELSVRGFQVVVVSPYTMMGGDDLADVSSISDCVVCAGRIRCSMLLADSAMWWIGTPRRRCPDMS